MSLATMMGLVHCCFLVLVLALITSGLGGNNSSNAQDVKKCDYKKIVACLEKQLRWIPKRFTERHHNKTNVTTSDDMFLKEVCRRNASECLRHSQSDGCVTEQRNTLDRFTKANTAALKALCENRMEIVKELYNDFLSWDIEGFKKCFSSMNVSAVAQDIFSVERSLESCRTLLNEVGRCMRNSYKKKTLEANSTKAADKILTSFFNEISCQEVKSSQLAYGSETLQSTTPSVTMKAGGALTLPSTRIHVDTSTRQDDGTSEALLQTSATSNNLLPVSPSPTGLELLISITPYYVPLHKREKSVAPNTKIHRDTRARQGQGASETFSRTSVISNNLLPVNPTETQPQLFAAITPQYVPLQSTEKAVVTSNKIHVDTSNRQGEETSEAFLQTSAMSNNLLPVSPTETELELLEAITPHHIPLQSAEKAVVPSTTIHGDTSTRQGQGTNQTYLHTSAISNNLLPVSSTETEPELMTAITRQYVPAQDTEKTLTDEGFNDRTTREPISAASLLPGLNLLNLAKPAVSDTRTQEVTFDNQEASLKVSVGTTEEMKHQPRTSPSKSGPAVFFRSTASVFLVTAVTAALNLIL